MKMDFFLLHLGPEPYKNSKLDQKKKLYTKRQVERAELARKLYRIIGFLRLQNYDQVVQTNQIKDCPVTVEDVKHL
jgi:hypothetical protein